MRLLFLSTLIGCPQTTTETWPSTADGDGDGWSVGEGDCDDDDPARHPGVTEVCDGIDMNCDEIVDNNLYVAAYRDLDGDGYGGERDNVCPDTPGFVRQSGDCDEADPNIHPHAPEICDEVDQDCDGEVDDGAQEEWYTDKDGDGYGRAQGAGCTVPAGTVTVGGDCDDSDAAVHPDAEEIWCDDVDNDCSEATGDGEACPGDTARPFPYLTAHVVIEDGAVVTGRASIQWRNLNLDKTLCTMERSIDQTGPVTTCPGCEWAFEYTLGPATYEGDWCYALPETEWWTFRDASELAFTYEFPERFSRGMSELTYYYTALTEHDSPVILGQGSAPGIGTVPTGRYVVNGPYDVYTSGLPYMYWDHMYIITY